MDTHFCTLRDLDCGGLQAARTTLSEGGRLRGGVKTVYLIHLANWEPGSMHGSPQWMLLRKAVGLARVCPGPSTWRLGRMSLTAWPSIYKTLGSIPSTRVGEKEVTLGTSQISTKDIKKRKRFGLWEQEQQK